jgi:hypothetical protein
MSAIEESVVPKLTDANDDDDLDHEFCCFEDWSLCGRDLSGADLVDEGTDLPNICIVCDLMTQCPMCGQVFEVSK